MKQKTVLFFAKMPMNAVVGRPLARRLMADPRIEVRFAGPAGADIRGILAEAGLAEALSASSWKARWSPVDLYFSPDMMFLPKFAKRSAQLYHGVSFKGKMYSDKVLAFDKLFLVGEDMRRRYVEKGILREDDPRIERVGFPKTDALLDRSLDRAAILRGLGLDPSRKTVLYAPTWRPEASLYTNGRELMRELGERPINLLIKLHDLCMDPDTNPVDWRAELPKFEKENVKAVRDGDIIPYLFASDVLISDASSAANEYTLLDRPILWMDAPRLFEKYKDTIDLGGWSRTTGEIVEDVAALHGALDRAFANPGERSEIRRAAAADIFYNAGYATDAAVHAAYRMLELNPV